VPAPIVHATTTTAAATTPTTQLVLNPREKQPKPEPVPAVAASTTTSTTTEVPTQFVIESTSTTAKVPFGNVDLSVDHGDGGTSKGFIVSVVSVAALVVAGFAFLRLRGR
jgi:hypothetical protein